ncbi:MAG: deoxyguanosinetriphosphate triphosphohydrolase, partial [Paracoccus sp. (in: a-proteobacteria)]
VRVTAILNELFPLFLSDPAQMPPQWHSAAEAAPDETRRARIVLDYVSGMTDRYAISEAQRLLTG